MLNNGQHIHLFQNLKAIETHFLSPHRMGGPQVLQRYIQKPLLIQGPTAGHKFTIRMLLVVSSHAGCALYPCGYLNIALKPYFEGNLSLLEAHLTNEHLSDARINVVQRLSDEMAIFQPYKPKIVASCQMVVAALKKQFADFWQTNKPQMGFFGFDFIIEANDNENQIWLLEINHGPCFPIEESHPLFSTLYRPFWQQVIKQFIDRQPSDFIVLD